MLMLKTIMSQHREFLWFAFRGKACQYKVLHFGLALTPRTFTKCLDAAPGPFEAPGHSCTQLPGRLTHSGPLQGVSELSQAYRPPPRSCSWPQNIHKEECFLPYSTNCVFGSSRGFSSNAGPSGSCPDFQPQYMFGPLQARPSCLREHLSQALKPHGCSLPCAAPGVAPHEAVPLVDETFRVPLHRTSHLPNQGVVPF